MTAFTPQQPPKLPKSNDPFIYNADGTIDFNLSGKLNVKKRAKFNSNVRIEGTLFVQDVDILQEIQNLNNIIGTLQSQISSLQS
jgi:hypothetical protein